MRNHFVRCACIKPVLILLNSLLVVLPSVGIAQQESRLEDVLSAWKKRAQHASAVSVSWDGKLTIAKAIDEQGQPKESALGTDASVPYSRCLKLKEFRHEHVYYSDNSVTRNGETGRLEDIVRITAVTAGKQTDVQKFASNKKFTEVRLDNATESNVLKTLAVKPLILSFRALEPAMAGYEPKSLQLASSGGVADDCECRIIEKRDRKGKVREEFWVDPLRDYIILKYVYKYAEGSTWNQIDIKYEPHAEVGWAPSSWRVVSLEPDGRQREFHEDTVSSIEVGNSVEDSEFVVEIPPNSLVMDATGEQRKRFQTDNEGNEVALNEKEAISIYNEGMEDVFPSIAEARGNSNEGRWFYWACGAATILLCAIGVARVVKRRAS